MKDILAARNALEAYFIISAVYRSVMTIGARNGRERVATLLAASWSVEPSTIRSGYWKSRTAEPSRKNSGLETTAKRTSDRFRLWRIMRVTTSPLPTGTVLLLIITA